MTTNLTLSLLFFIAASVAMRAAHADAKPRGAYADVNGIHLYYEIRGKGDPLVLLHGGLGAIEMFGDTVGALAKSHQVIAVDLQGHGRTAVGARPITFEAMADDIDALLATLKIDKADLVGYSLGGAVALQTAIRHPQRVGKLVLISTPFRRAGWYPEILAGQAGITAAAADGMKQTPIYALYAKLAPRAQDWPVLLTKLGALLATDYDWRKEVAAVKAPILLVVGDADAVITSHTVAFFGLLGGGKRDAGWMGEHKAASKLAILPDTTHYNVFVSPLLPAVIEPFLAPLR